MDAEGFSEESDWFDGEDDGGGGSTSSPSPSSSTTLSSPTASILKQALLDARRSTRRIDPKKKAHSALDKIKRKYDASLSGSKEGKLLSTIGGALLDASQFAGEFAVASPQAIDKAAVEVAEEITKEIDDAYGITAPSQGSQTHHVRSCFPAGTQILMADGDSNPIESIAVDDLVLSYDLEARKTTKARVRELSRAKIESYYRLNNNLLRITGDHPIYTKKKDGSKVWAVIDSNAVARAQKANDPLDRTGLEAGDKVFTKDGTWQEITTIEYIPEDTEVFNLKTIEKHHTFFADGVLVHNGGSEKF